MLDASFLDDNDDDDDDDDDDDVDGDDDGGTQCAKQLNNCIRRCKAESIEDMQYNLEIVCKKTFFHCLYECARVLTKH